MNTSWLSKNGKFEITGPFMWNNTYAFYENGTAYNDTFYEDYDELYEVPTSIIVLLSFCYLSISVLAIIGNSLVIWIIIKSKQMQNVTHFFIANLAGADIVIGCFAIPFQFQAALLQRWILPHFMCAFCPFVQILCVNVSVFTLTAIAIDRHRAILKPLSAKPSKLAAKMIIGGIWLVSGSLAAPMAAALSVMNVSIGIIGGREHYKPFCQNTNMSENTMLIYRVLLVLLQYFTPLSVISWVYGRMGLKLWGNRAPGNAEDSRDANLMRNKKKVIVMLVIVVALFAICWLPLQTYNVLQCIYPSINEYRYINIIWFCCDWLAMSNSCYNPFIYGIYNEKFKREFRQRFHFKLRNWSNNPRVNSLSAEKNQSGTSRSSAKIPRQNQRRPNAPVNTPVTAYKGVPSREPSGLALNKNDLNQENKNMTTCCVHKIQNNHFRTPKNSTKTEELCVFLPEKYKHAGELAIEELCL